jgi:hypothetical protein
VESANRLRDFRIALKPFGRDVGRARVSLRESFGDSYYYYFFLGPAKE